MAYNPLAERELRVLRQRAGLDGEVGPAVRTPVGHLRRARPRGCGCCRNARSGSVRTARTAPAAKKHSEPSLTFGRLSDPIRRTIGDAIGSCAYRAPTAALLARRRLQSGRTYQAVAVRRERRRCSAGANPVQQLSLQPVGIAADDGGDDIARSTPTTRAALGGGCPGCSGASVATPARLWQQSGVKEGADATDNGAVTGYEHLWMLKAHLDDEDAVHAELQTAG